MLSSLPRPSIEVVLEHYGAEYVPLRLGWASMYCPFHEDRTKSGSVNTDEGWFKCFTCDVSGDVYDLIQMKEGIDFRESVKFGADKFGTGDSQLRGSRSGGKLIPGRTGDRSRARRYVPPGRRHRPGGRT